MNLVAANAELMLARIQLLESMLAEHTSWKPGVGPVAPIKPGHGGCCTCQKCGYPHDECYCEHNEIERRLGEVPA